MRAKLVIREVREEERDQTSWGDYNLFDFNLKDARLTWSKGLRPLVLAVYTGDTEQVSRSGRPAAVEAFDQVFPSMLRKLTVGKFLTMSLEGLDKNHFDPLFVIDKVLMPKGFPYALVRSDKMVSSDGILFFEFPKELGQEIVDKWFAGFVLTIRGLVSEQRVLADLVHLCFSDNPQQLVDALLRKVLFAFKVWTDNDGMLICSTNLDRSWFENTIDAQSFDDALAKRPQ